MSEQMKPNMQCPKCNTAFILFEDDGFMAMLPDGNSSLCWSSMRCRQEVSIFGPCPSCSHWLTVTISKDAGCSITAKE